MVIDIDFNLGQAAAEDDTQRIRDSFVSTKIYDKIISREDPRCFILGRTGSGKSAILKKLEQEKKGHVIRIDPKSLSFSYIINIRNFEGTITGENLPYFWTILWQHVIITSVLKHRYQNMVQRNNFLENFKQKIESDKKLKSFSTYLDQFGNIFWEDGQTQIEEIFKSQTANGNIHVDLNAEIIGVNGSKEKNLTAEEKSSRTNSINVVINRQLVNLLKDVVNILNEEILDSQHFTYVIIDDLDTDWVDKKYYTDLIFSLLDIAKDSQYKENIKILVALRTNIWQRLKFETHMDKQEEKYESLSWDIDWTTKQLEEVLDKRVTSVSKELNLNYHKITEMLPNKNPTMGDPLEYVFNRTLYRPRDAIDFINKGLTRAAGQDALVWDNIYKAENDYSKGRLSSIRDEWSVNYPHIEQVIKIFSHSNPYLNSNELDDKFLECASTLLPIISFREDGWEWLTEATQAHNDNNSDWTQRCGPLLTILYKIGFIGLSITNDNSNVIFNVDEKNLLDEFDVYEKYKFFCIHPMFYSILGIKAPIRFKTKNRIL